MSAPPKRPHARRQDLYNRILRSQHPVHPAEATRLRGQNEAYGPPAHLYFWPHMMDDVTKAVNNRVESNANQKNSY